MKSYKRLLFICIAACSLFLGGCGDALHELTVEEESLIVHYAAYAVAKHNIQQKDGMSGVLIPEAEPENTESVDTPDSTEVDDTQTPEGQGGTSDTPQVEDTTVTMAVKSHLRQKKPVLVAVSTNDALSSSAQNIGRLLNVRNMYFVPFAQDAPEIKNNSLVADFLQIPQAVDAALNGRQLQPLLLSTES